MKTLFFFLWLTQTTLFSHPAVHQRIATHPAMNMCNHTWVHLGKSAKKRDIKAVLIPGTSKKTIYILGSIHGDEKAGAVLTTNLILNLCANSNKQRFTALIVPVANPDGFDKHGNGRWNGAGQDLNRDAFNKSQRESKALFAPFRLYDIVRFVDIHMTGNVVLFPRPWTRAYKASRTFQKRLKQLGLTWRTRNGAPYGMWYSMASELGIPSVLIEIGPQRSHLRYHRGHYFKLVYKPLLALYRLFFVKSLPSPKNLRKGTPGQRIQKYERSKRHRKRYHMKRRLRRIFAERALKRLPKHLRRFYIYWKFATKHCEGDTMRYGKAAKDHSDKTCCCGGHNANNPKSNKRHHSTYVRLQIRRRQKEAAMRRMGVANLQNKDYTCSWST